VRKHSHINVSYGWFRRHAGTAFVKGGFTF
jgi:hypothetical protein